MPQNQDVKRNAKIEPEMVPLDAATAPPDEAPRGCASNATRP